MELVDDADLWKIIVNPESSLDECCMAAAISCGKIDRAYRYAEQVAKKKSKYYQHLDYFLDKYSP
tara:strand:+ start:402 stop:596 length:195 start_codon:yes stop_codon:yes gene_type:complete